MPDESLHPDPQHALPAPEHELLLPKPDADAIPFEEAAAAQSAREHDLAMRMLYDQQARLQTELDELRKKQAEGGEKKEGEDEEGGGEGDKKDKKDDEKESKPATVPTQEQRTKRARYIFLGVLIAIPLLLVLLLLLWYLGSYENTDDAFIDGHTDPISSRINGTVANVYVENTYRVKKGQLLLQIDPRDNQVSREQAQANYDQAVAAARAQAPQVTVTANQQGTQLLESDLDVLRLQAQVAQQTEQYHSALADLHQSEATESNAAREEQRYRMLVVKDEVSVEQYDQRLTQRNAAAEEVASRRGQAEAANNVVRQAEAQLEQARARAKRDRANLPRQVEQQKQTLAQRQAQAFVNKSQLDQAELNLEYTRIYAPEEGIIGDKQVQVQSRVTPGQEMFALTQTSDIWVTANFKETQIQKMRPGQPVKIHVDALDEDFDGFVENLPGGSGAIYSLLPPENATGNYVKVVQRLPVRIRFKPGQKDAGRLAPGMSVEPKVWLR